MIDSWFYFWILLIVGVAIFSVLSIICEKFDFDLAAKLFIILTIACITILILITVTLVAGFIHHLLCGAASQ